MKIFDYILQIRHVLIIINNVSPTGKMDTSGNSFATTLNALQAFNDRRTIGTNATLSTECYRHSPPPNCDPACPTPITT
jgi:hypothetical protein